MTTPVRLIAIDIDGTLMPTRGVLSARNARALELAQQAGFTVVVATGRRQNFAVPVLHGVKLRADTPLITSNGTVTRTLDGRRVSRSTLEARVARGLYRLMHPYGMMVFTFDREGPDELVVDDLGKANAHIDKWVTQNRPSMTEVRPLEQALADGDDPIQGMAAGSVAAMQEALAALRASQWAGQCECVLTEYPGRDLAILDLLPPGISKRWGLERLAAELGVARGEVMAIGDNWNDLTMLEWAGYPVLMANAAGELRALARENGWRIAPSNDEDGVAVVLEETVAAYSTTGGQGDLR